MIFHPRIKKISLYLDGLLSSEQRAHLDRHFETCMKCRNTLKLLQQTVPAAVSIPEEKIKPIAKTIMETISPRQWNTKVPIIGEVVSVIGLVLVKSRVDDEANEVLPGIALRKGDTISTSNDSKALIRLNDGSEIYVNKETTLDFEPRSFNLAIKIGEIFAMMNPQKKTYVIHTPAAVLGVVGTDFDADVKDQNTTRLTVLKGSVYYRNESGSTLVSQKRQVEATPATKPVPTRITDSRRIAGWTGEMSASRREGGWVSKKIGVALIAVVALCALGIGGFWLYDQFFGEVPYTYTLAPTPTPLPTPIPTTQLLTSTNETPAILPVPDIAVVLPSNDTPITRPLPVVGERVIMQIDQTSEAIIEVPGNQSPVRTRQIMMQKIAISNLQQLPDDILLTESVFISVSMSTEAPSGRMSVSSDGGAPQGKDALALWNMVRAMSGSKIYFYIDRDQEITKIEGLDKIMDKVRATCPPEIVQQMQANLDEDTMKNSMKVYGQVLPNHPVKVGDDWSFQSKMDIPMLGKTNSEMKYTFKGWEAFMGRPAVVLSLSGSMSSKGAKIAPILGPTIAIRDGIIFGSMHYDPQTGNLLDSTINQKLTLDLTQKIRDRRGVREEKFKGEVTNYITSKLLAEDTIR